MTPRYHASNIAVAMDVADRQGWDVLAVSSFGALEGWGTRRGCVVLMAKEQEGSIGYRVTKHYDENDEFDQGFYFDEIEHAQKMYIERVRRTMLDARLYDEMKGGGWKSR